MLFLIKLAIIVYIALIALIVFLQRKLMYHPVRVMGNPAEHGLLNIQETFITSSDGVKLQIWEHTAKPGYPTIVYFHGNAINLSDRAPKFSAFADNGFGLVAVGYRGFGKSGGSISETGIYRDARAAVDYTLTHFSLTQKQLIYYGESLGSGVAVQMATERTPGLLMLEAAYTSVETRSAELYPFIIGVRHFVKDKYDSLSKIKNVHAPLLMLHGEEDAVIPIHHGKALFAAANDPKEMVIYKGVHHADFSNEQIVEPLIRESKKLGLIE